MIFQIDEETTKKIQEWKNSLKDPDTCGTIGDRFTYSFTPTSLGCIIKVKDGLTSEEKDFTDYDMW